jgi:hypothetical protein
MNGENRPLATDELLDFEKYNRLKLKTIGKYSSF